MDGLLWTDAPHGLPVFLLLTFLGGAAAFATGRTLASDWNPAWLILPASLALACAVRFLHFALFQETLTSLHYYLVSAAILTLAAWTGYRATRARQMATQYSWAFEKSGLGWRAR
jgi:hypothetical protein